MATLTDNPYSNEITQRFARQFENRLRRQNWNDPLLPENRVEAVCAVMGDAMRSIYADHVIKAIIAELDEQEPLPAPEPKRRRWPWRR